MSKIIAIRFDGDLLEQLLGLKMIALASGDEPILWRLPEETVEMALVLSRSRRMPNGYVTSNRLFGIPMDLVRTNPHLLCDPYVYYPFTPAWPPIIRP